MTMLKKMSVQKHIDYWIFKNKMFSFMYPNFFSLNKHTDAIKNETVL